MTAGEEIVDSPIGWVARHIRGYVESGGRRGHRWSGVRTLLLVTRGRRTGTLRRTALIYGRDGDRYVVVSSNGRRSARADWYLNLRANPDVIVQVGSDLFAARARPATAQERPRLWRTMVRIWPDYRRHQYRAGRKIPMVVIEPAETGGPPGSG